jgi:hypothetical protein
MSPVDLAFRQGYGFFSECLEAGDSTSSAKICGIVLGLFLVSGYDLLTATEAAALEPAEHQLQQG